MGAGVSLPKLLPSKISSQEELKLKTQDVSQLASELFQFMYTQYDVNEVWDIANKPEDYIVELSHLIQNHFHIIGYTSETTTAGEMYFTRKADLLKHFDKATQSAADRKENEKNAKIIAFFFVRIFQILGAMLLVIRNVTLDIPDQTSEDGRPILGAPLARTYRGGGDADAVLLGPFDFLRKYMKVLDATDKSLLGADPAGMSSYKITQNLFFRFRTLTGDKVTKDSVKEMKPTLVVLAKPRGSSAVRPYEFELSISSISPASLDNKVPKKSELFSIPQETIFYIKPTDSRVTEKEISRELVTIRYKQDPDSDRISYEIVPTEVISPVLKDYTLTRDLPLIIQDYALSQATRRNPSLQLELREKVERATGDETSSTSTRKLFNPDKISIKTIKDGYSDLRPRVQDNKSMMYGPHCIKRATELLDAASIEKGYSENSRTNICRFSAPDESKELISLDEYKPTKSIAQLYGKLDVKKVSKSDFNEAIQVIEAFVKSPSGDPTLTTFTTDKLIADNQKEEAEALKVGLARLKAAFDSESKADAKGFADLSMRKPEECKTIKPEQKNPDGSVKLGQAMTGQLQSVSRELLAYHVNNTVEITKFLKKIFSIEFKNGVWTPKGINNSILFAGFPALDAITNQARELLVDYYVGCENVYQKGVKSWKAENKAAPAAAAPAVVPEAAPAPVAANAPCSCTCTCAAAPAPLTR
jgi:hypothetical protein